MRSDSPWAAVLRTIRGFEDAHALMCLYERACAADRDLTAGGASIGELTAPHFPSERAVAEALAHRLRELTGDAGWSDADLVAWSRWIETTEEEVEGFARRCRSGGILFG